MAAHSSILAWRIPRSEEPDGTVHGIARVRHDLAAKPLPKRIYHEPKMNAMYYGELFETFILKSGIREGCSQSQLHLTLRNPALGQNPM